MKWTKFDERLGEDGIRKLREKVRWTEAVIRTYGSLDAYWDMQRELRWNER